MHNVFMNRNYHRCIFFALLMGLMLFFFAGASGSSGPDGALEWRFNDNADHRELYLLMMGDQVRDFGSLEVFQQARVMCAVNLGPGWVPFGIRNDGVAMCRMNRIADTPTVRAELQRLCDIASPGFKYRFDVIRQRVSCARNYGV